MKWDWVDYVFFIVFPAGVLFLFVMLVLYIAYEVAKTFRRKP